MSRFCYYIPVGQFNERGYIPSVVTEGEAGHSPCVGRDDMSEPWYWGSDYDTARRICADANAKLGLTPDDVTAIVASSIGAQIQGDAVTERQNERLRRLGIRDSMRP